MPKAERTYQSPLGFSYTDRDVEKLAEAALGEARSQGNIGMQAVMNNIVNRTIDGGFGGHAITKVVGSQYSYTQDHNLGDARSILASNSPLASTARQMALQAVTGKLEDVTGGSTGYHNPETAKLSKWQRDGLASGTAKVIGDHVFYNADPDSRAAIQAAYTMSGAPAPVQEASMWDKALQAPMNAVNSIEDLLGFAGTPATAKPAPVGPDVGEMMAGPELAAAAAKPIVTPGRPITNERTLDPLGDINNISNTLASSSPQPQVGPGALGTNASLLSSLGLAGQPVPAPGRVLNMGLAPPTEAMPYADEAPHVQDIIGDVLSKAPGASKPVLTNIGKPIEGKMISTSSIVNAVLGKAPGAAPTSVTNFMTSTPEARQVQTGMTDEQKVVADVGGVPSLGTLSPGYMGPDDYGAQQVMAASVTPSANMATQAPDLSGEFGGTDFGSFSPAPMAPSFAAPAAPAGPAAPSAASMPSSPVMTPFSEPAVAAPSAKFQDRVAPTITPRAAPAVAPTVTQPAARPAPMAAAVDNPLAAAVTADPSLGVPSLADPNALSSLAGITSGYSTTPEEAPPEAQQPAPETPQVTPRAAPPPTTVEQAPVEAAAQPQQRVAPPVQAGPEQTFGPLPQDQAVVGSGVFDENGQMVGRIDKEGKATALPGIGTALKDIGRGALKGSAFGPAGSLIGALFGGISSQANLFGGPESKSTYEPTSQSDVIGSTGRVGGPTNNGLLAAANALNLGKPPEGYSYGWSPFGNGLALVSDHAPEALHIAASGTGIFGALGLAPSNKVQPQTADKNTGVGGFFHNLFGGGSGPSQGAGGLSGPTVSGTGGLY